MNMLYREHAEGATLFGKAINLYATQEAAAKANINRIEFLLSKIHTVVKAVHGRIRLASIGCGPAHEVSRLLERWPDLGPQLDIALIDQEDRSISYCERTITPLARHTGARVKFINESIRKLLVARPPSRLLGERELIYSAGLFDYLNDRAFVALLRPLYDALVPGGVMAIGNVAPHNPSRHAMEYFSDWHLNHRSSEELLRLGGRLEPAPAEMRVEAEPLGVNIFLIVRR
jgi:extracellular factor (EF) 3-hydroxypalmitic acid methyl ester biosynthesis protein